MESYIEKIKRIATKQPKKVAFLVALTAVFCYVWIPLFMKKSGPAPNAAARKNAAARSRAGTSDASTNAGGLSEVLDNYELPEFLAEPMPASMLPCNPFVSLVPDEPEEEEQVVQKEIQVQEVELLREKERTRAGALEVSCILLAKRKKSCVVDGALLYVGSNYNGFTVKEIRQQSIVIAGEYDEYTVRVQQSFKSGPPSTED